MAKHLTIPGALEWDAVERHSIATLRYAGGKEHDVKYVSEVAYDALKAELDSYRKGYVTRFAYEALRSSTKRAAGSIGIGSCGANLLRFVPRWLRGRSSKA